MKLLGKALAIRMRAPVCAYHASLQQARKAQTVAKASYFHI